MLNVLYKLWFASNRREANTWKDPIVLVARPEKVDDSRLANILHGVRPLFSLWLTNKKMYYFSGILAFAVAVTALYGITDYKGEKEWEQAEKRLTATEER